MGKAGIIFLGLIFDVSALICWVLAARHMSAEYIWHGIALFAVGVILGSVGSNQKK